MNKAYSFDDVLMIPKYTDSPSRSDKRIVTTGQLHKLFGYNFPTPIISANMDTITGVRMAKKMSKLGGLGILHRFCSIEDNVKMFLEAQEYTTDFYQDGTPVERPSNCIGVSVGVNEGLDRAKALYEAGARLFCVDVAHGHSKVCGDIIKDLKREFEDILIIAGNVATPMGVDYLVGCGADVVKVGIGPGSACTTRIKTGFGIPQFTAIQECAKACSKPIIADGGIRTPGDVAKALGAGATMVMLGGMLAGADETPGEIITPKDIPDNNLGKTYSGNFKSFRGMASKEANEDQFGAMPDWKTAEGIATIVPCKGPVEHIIKDILGGLRSALTYCGAFDLDEFRRKVEFVEVTQAGRAESVAHINN